VSRLRNAACPNCGAALQVDPVHEFATCTYCGTKSFVETRRRPVTEAIRIQQHPIIQVRPPRRGCVSSLVSSALMLIGGIWVYTHVQGLSAQRLLGALSGITSALPSALPSSVTTSVAAPEADINYFSDPNPALKMYESRIGSPIQALTLVLYPTYAALQAQDPAHPENVDTYALVAGKIASVSPVSLGSNQTRLAHLLFSLSDAHLGQLPARIRSAVSDIAIPGAAATHVIVQRDFGRAKSQPVIRVYVDSGRANGYVEYAVDGTRIRIVK